MNIAAATPNRVRIDTVQDALAYVGIKQMGFVEVEELKEMCGREVVRHARAIAGGAPDPKEQRRQIRLAACAVMPKPRAIAAAIMGREIAPATLWAAARATGELYEWLAQWDREPELDLLERIRAALREVPKDGAAAAEPTQPGPKAAGAPRAGNVARPVAAPAANARHFDPDEHIYGETAAFTFTPTMDGRGKRHMVNVDAALRLPGPGRRFDHANKFTMALNHGEMLALYAVMRRQRSASEPVEFRHEHAGVKKFLGAVVQPKGVYFKMQRSGGRWHAVAIQPEGAARLAMLLYGQLRRNHPVELSVDDMDRLAMGASMEAARGAAHRPARAASSRQV